MKKPRILRNSISLHGEFFYFIIPILQICLSGSSALNEAPHKWNDSCFAAMCRFEMNVCADSHNHVWCRAQRRQSVQPLNRRSFDSAHMAWTWSSHWIEEALIPMQSLQQSVEDPPILSSSFRDPCVQKLELLLCAAPSSYKETESNRYRHAWHVEACIDSPLCLNSISRLWAILSDVFSAAFQPPLALSIPCSGLSVDPWPWDNNPVFQPDAVWPSTAVSAAVSTWNVVYRKLFDHECPWEVLHWGPIVVMMDAILSTCTIVYHFGHPQLVKKDVIFRHLRNGWSFWLVSM